MEFEQDDFGWIKAKLPNGGHLRRQKVETCLLLAILEKLEEIRCVIIDVETAINNQGN